MVLIVNLLSLDNADGDKEELIMNKLPFRVKTSDYATMSKKGNMVYWDAIDDWTENYVRSLIDFSTKQVELDDDIAMDIAKRITEFATNLFPRLEVGFTAHGHTLCDEILRLLRTVKSLLLLYSLHDKLGQTEKRGCAKDKINVRISELYVCSPGTCIHLGC